MDWQLQFEHLSGRGKQGIRRLLRYLAKASLTSLEKQKIILPPHECCSPWEETVDEGVDVFFVVTRSMIGVTLNFFLALHHMAGQEIIKYWHFHMKVWCKYLKISSLVALQAPISSWCPYRLVLGPSDQLDFGTYIVWPTLWRGLDSALAFG